MEKKRSIIREIVFLAITVVISCGCASSRVDLVKSGSLTIEHSEEGKVQIAWSGAYEQAGELWISGVLIRHDHVGTPIKARVEAMIVSPDGQSLDTACSKDVYVPRRITGRGQSLKRFNIHIPHVPPQGSCVHLVCHSDPR